MIAVMPMIALRAMVFGSVVRVMHSIVRMFGSIVFPIWMVVLVMHTRLRIRPT